MIFIPLFSRSVWVEFITGKQAIMVYGFCQYLRVNSWIVSQKRLFVLTHLLVIIQSLLIYFLAHRLALLMSGSHTFQENVEVVPLNSHDHFYILFRLVYICLFLMHASCPIHLTLFDLIILIILGKDKKLFSSSLCSFPLPFVITLFQVSSSSPYSQTLSGRAILSRPLVIMAWHILSLETEEMASR